MEVQTKLQYRINEVVTIDLDKAALYTIVCNFIEMDAAEFREIVSPKIAADLAAAALRCVEYSIDGAPFFREQDVLDFKSTVCRIVEKLELKSQCFRTSEKCKKA